jgi:2-methylcitrate dehydratase PrpD
MSSWCVLDEAAHERVRQLVVDALALAAAGTANDDARRALAGLAAVAPGETTVPWTDLRLSAPQAALALSMLIHAWDFDDTHDEAVVHTATVVVPSALAAGAIAPVPGDRLLGAVAAGVQVFSRLARLVGARPGVIRTAGVGPVAAAVTAAHVFGLDEETTRAAAALAVGSTLSPSSRQAVVDGSVAKRLQPGFAAATGLTAAGLARAGLSGPHGWLTGDFGMLPGTDTTWPDLLTGAAEIDDVAIKPYPACRYTHAALVAAHEVHATEPTLAPGDRVVVHVPAGAAYALVARPYAERGEPLVDAQFSIPWQIAAVWATGSYELQTLTSHLHDPRIPQLARQVEVRQDLPESAVMSGARLDLVRDGAVVATAHADMPGAGAALPREVLGAKARSCLEVAGVADPGTAVEHLFGLVDALPDLDADATTLALRELTPGAPTLQR